MVTIEDMKFYLWPPEHPTEVLVVHLPINDWGSHRRGRSRNAAITRLTHVVDVVDYYHSVVDRVAVPHGT